MKKTISFILLSIFLVLRFNQSYAQESENEIFDNLDVSGSVTIDNITNLMGGIQKGTTLLGLFDLVFDYHINTGLFKNTSLHAHFQKTAGWSASENLIGDIQVASNIDGKSTHFIYELLVKQKVGNFTFVAGMHDLNSEFIMSEFGGDFINSSFGIQPAVSLNVPVSIFPVTSFGGLLLFNKNNLDITAGFYNLNHKYLEEESFNYNNHFFQHGYFGISEIRYRLNRGNSKIGEYKLGSYIKKCEHEELSPEDCVIQKNYGIYFIADQILKEFDSGEQLGLFIQLGKTPLKRNFASEFYGGGISLRSISKNWLPDQFGLALGRVKLNNLTVDTFSDANNFETVIECTTQISFLNHFTIQPDIQYIINPSGSLNNSLTGIIRIILEF